MTDHVTAIDWLCRPVCSFH